eukprot:SAG31_NODE_406_length_16063_cov_22.636056_4_plen_117_part_00
MCYFKKFVCLGQRGFVDFLQSYKKATPTAVTWLSWHLGAANKSIKDLRVLNLQLCISPSSMTDTARARDENDSYTSNQDVWICSEISAFSDFALRTQHQTNRVVSLEEYYGRQCGW